MKPVHEVLSTEALLEQLAEECAELGKAALKVARINRGENPTPLLIEDAISNLVEEVGDVRVCLEVLQKKGFDFNTESRERYKMQRWEERLHELLAHCGDDPSLARLAFSGRTVK